VLRLPDAWVWDFWLAEDRTSDQTDRHIFYLKASRALHDPDRRHLRASIGHAVSTDLRAWTGSLLRGPDGSWYLFYTGVSIRGDALLQQIGLARSDDLVT
jgi:beta-fructofuranosidase